MNLEQQFTSLLIMILSSLCIGVFFDGFRVLKGKMYFPKIIVFLIDIGFGVFSALLVFYFLIWVNDGQLRGVMVLTFFIGLFIYYLTLSKSIVRIWGIFYSILSQLIKTIYKIIDFTILRPITSIYKLLVIILTFIISIIGFIGQFIKKLFLRIYKSIKRTTKGKYENIKAFIIKKKDI